MKGRAAAVDEVLVMISDALRPHCRLSEEDLLGVSEHVLALGARHALDWVEGGGGGPTDVAAVSVPSETFGSWKRRLRVRVS